LSSAFRHVDRARTILFGADAVERGDDLIGSGFTLLSTGRAIDHLPQLAERAEQVVHVPGGLVEEIAGSLRAQVTGGRLVALGGGRVIDVAKALTAADPPRTLVAIPTTLSAAEMTGGHRHAVGVTAGTPHARAGVILNDPSISASQPLEGLAASSANALAHALAGLLSDRATPITQAVAAEAIRRLESGWSGVPPAEPERTELALGALLAGWAMDVTGTGLHHVLAQTAVRTIDVSHGNANAALLPFTLSAMAARRPWPAQPLEGDARALAERLRELSGADLRALAEDEALLERAVLAAAGRAELDRMAPRPTTDELRELYLAAARL
jgi:alcohol dehydrogenase class IV